MNENHHQNPLPPAKSMVQPECELGQDSGSRASLPAMPASNLPVSSDSASVFCTPTSRWARQINETPKKEPKANSPIKGEVRTWTWKKLAALTVVACVASAVSAKLYVDKQIEDLLVARDLSEWNTNFAKEPQLHSGVATRLSSEDSKALEEALAIVKRNRDIGKVVWSDLNKHQVELVLGIPPIELWRFHHYEGAPVYFDRYLNGFIVDFNERNESRVYPARLADVSPTLQSVAVKFHLKPSKYLPEILGLDPDYVHERIVRPRSAASRQIGR